MATKTLQELVDLIEREDRAKKLAVHLCIRRDRLDLRDPIEAWAYELIARELMHTLGVAVVGELRVLP
jgi:hypothetical protein